MNTRDLYWIAGLLEGEGCFYEIRVTRPNKVYTYPAIQLAMTDEDVMQRAADILGVPKATLIPRTDGRKDIYSFRISGKKAVAIMEEILPIMGGRRSAKIADLLG